MKYEPKSEEQLRKETAQPVFPAGEYPFEVVSAADETSKKSGKPMVHATVKVFGPGGKTTLVHDYLMVTDPRMEFKWRHFCFACGLGALYASGEVLADKFARTSGHLKLGIQPEKDSYPEKNKVDDYIVNSGKPEPEHDESMPF